jgi:hypothetical protein
MSTTFQSPVAAELRNFLVFKRSLGYRYGRAEYTLHEFDRFLVGYVEENPKWQMDRAAIAWMPPSSGSCSLIFGGSLISIWWSRTGRLFQPNQPSCRTT